MRKTLSMTGISREKLLVTAIQDRVLPMVPLDPLVELDVALAPDTKADPVGGGEHGEARRVRRAVTARAPGRHPQRTEVACQETLTEHGLHAPAHILYSTEPPAPGPKRLNRDYRGQAATLGRAFLAP